MSKKNREVPIQKGTVMSNPPTSKQMTYKEKVAEKEREMGVLRDNLTLKEESPKK